MTHPTAPRRLPAAEEETLVREAHLGSKRATAALVQAHLGLVHAYARRVWHRNQRLDYDDLVQEGHIGLLEGIQRYELGHDTRLASYATWWIRLALQRYVLRNGRATQMSRTSVTQRLFAQLRATKARRQARGLPTDPETLSVELRVPAQLIVEFDTWLSDHEISLQEPLRAKDSRTRGTVGDLLPDGIDSIERLEEIHERAILLAQAKQFRASLSDAEQKVFDARVISAEVDTPTLTDMGKMIGRTRQRVFQIESDVRRRFLAHLFDEGVGVAAQA